MYTCKSRAVVYRVDHIRRCTGLFERTIIERGFMEKGYGMNGRTRLVMCGVAWLAIAMFYRAAQAQDGVPKDDIELIRYAAAPELWGEVERVLRSDVELH